MTHYILLDKATQLSSMNLIPVPDLNQRDFVSSGQNYSNNILKSNSFYEMIIAQSSSWQAVPDQTKKILAPTLSFYSSLNFTVINKQPLCSHSYQNGLHPLRKQIIFVSISKDEGYLIDEQKPKKLFNVLKVPFQWQNYLLILTLQNIIDEHFSFLFFYNKSPNCSVYYPFSFHSYYDLAFDSSTLNLRDRGFLIQMTYHYHYTLFVQFFDLIQLNSLYKICSSDIAIYFSINRMESIKKYQFKAITALKLIDLKAAKKTVPFKKFCNIPLSYQEELKQNFQTTYIKNFEDGENIQPERTLTKGRFRKSLNKLARPRHNTLPKPSSNSEIGKILKKCKRLMNNGLHCKSHMNRFQKYSDLCLNTIQKRMTNLISDGLTANYYYI